MKAYRLSLLSTAISTIVFCHSAHAAAFQLYELGTPIVGTAGVGQAAVAEDASTSYFNPAGMSLLPSTQFMLGSQMMLTYVNFKRNSLNTIRGDNGGNAGGLLPGMDVYFSYHYSPKVSFGVAMTGPYGGALDYTNGWVGRYTLQGVLFYTVNLNPGFSYQVNNWLALGAGVSIEYINLQETVALPIFGQLIDGQAKVVLANFAPGFNVGALLTPNKETKIGIAYRSQIVHHLHGNTTFENINATPTTTSKMVMPANIIISAAEDITNRVTLLGELGWANWSTMRDTVLTVGRFTAVTPQQWSNTYRFGLGGQFKATPVLTLQAGASCDTSPTTSARRLPDLPMDRQVRVGAGVMYALIKQVTLAASYEYLNLGRANINNSSAIGVLAGAYSRNYANTLQVSVNAAV